MDLSGRIALVTGSARRLGRAIATALARRGVHVAVHYRTSADEAARAVQEFQELGVRSRAYRADLSSPADIDRLFDEIGSEFGGLDILVNNAAVFERKPIDEIAAEDWDRVLAVNLRAPFLCAQRAARLMKPRGGGRIVNLADLSAFEHWTGYAHHSVSKAGLVALTRVLAKAFAPQILVNTVAPGPVLPPDSADERERSELAARTALKRLGSPEDAVQAVLFLLESDYQTGQVLVVDGGKLLL
ncbi:MAG: SDR family oxidoreductase [Gemmatimonadetes bacterium]|nr:SDR family oxidoreductase [Gemmatimonadota bacterium]